MDSTYYKSIILTIVRSHPRRKLTIQELRKELLNTAHLDLNLAANIHGYSNIIEYLESYSDVLRMKIDGPRTVIEAIQGDHITEMNKRSKNTRKSYIPLQMDQERIQEVYDNHQFYQNESDIDVFRSVFCSLENNTKDENISTDCDGPELKLPLCPTSRNAKNIDADSSDDDEKRVTNYFQAIMKLRKCRLKILNQNNDEEHNIENNHQTEEIASAMRQDSNKGAMPKNTEVNDRQQSNSNGNKNYERDNSNHMVVVPKYKVPIKTIYNVRLTSDFTFVNSLDKSLPTSKCINFEPAKDVKSIQILDAVNPHRFWFCEFNDYLDFKKLNKRIKSFYNENINSFKFSVEEIKPGLMAAVLHRDNWRRAKILKLINYQQYRVFLVDYGSIVNINFENFRYLKEDLFQLPPLAQRGVLAYVQPIHKYWSNEANQCFDKKAMHQKLNAKIYRVSKENSYYMSLKAQNGELIANELILKDYGELDKFFLQKDPVNSYEMPFDDYENGKYADISTAVALQSADSWLPSVKVTSNETNGFEAKNKSGNEQNSISSKWTPNSNINKHHSYRGMQMITPLVPFNQNMQMQPFMRPRQLFPPTFNHQPPFQPRFSPNMNICNRHKQTGNFPNQVKKAPNKNKKHPGVHLNQIKSSSEETIVASSAGSSPEKERVVQIKKWQIEPQKYDTMVIDTQIKISIRSVEKSNLFYFLNFDELHEMAKFFDDFNESYKSDKSYHTKSEIQFHKDVVVYHDLNFCRGRVVSTEHKNGFDIFLLDYGVTISRKVKEIFYLKKEFMHRQAAVYKGSLNNEQAKLPSEIHGILVDLKEKLATAKIVSISDAGVIKIDLLNYNPIE